MGDGRCEGARMSGTRDGVEGLGGVLEVLDVEDGFGIGQSKGLEPVIDATLRRSEVGDAGRGGDACADKHNDPVHLAAFDEVGDVFDICHFVSAQGLSLMIVSRE